MFRPLLMGHHQVTSLNFEEAVHFKSFCDLHCTAFSNFLGIYYYLR